jgi:thioredoxin-like negative regulator of GroEL
LIERDRKNTGETARQLMIDAFRVLGNDEQITRDYRRKLSLLLY